MRVLSNRALRRGLVAITALSFFCFIPPGVLFASGKMQLKAAAFQSGGTIPSRYSCSGEDVSPALNWTEVPSGTKSFVLTVTDPDAPGHVWVHWVIFNLPPQARSLPEAVPATERIANGALQGSNDFEKLGYGGPCPPPGKPHHYHFRLYALNVSLQLKPGVTRQELEAAMKGHVLARSEIIGLFGR